MKDPFAHLPADQRREINRALKLNAYGELIREFEGEDFFSQLAAFSIRQQMLEDPDLADLEEHRDTLVAFVKRLHGMRDAFYTCPWTRFPRDLAYNGHLAQMSAGEAKVYMALLALVDTRSLVTCAGIQTIADMAGRSISRTSKLLTRLKKIYKERKAAQEEKIPATIDARPGTVYEDVSEVLDQAIEAKFTDITFVGAYDDHIK